MTTDRSEGSVGPSLDYLHGFRDALEVAFAVAWDLQGNPEAPGLVIDRLERVLNDIRGDRLEAAVRAAGADELRGYWSPCTDFDEFWSSG